MDTFGRALNLKVLGGFRALGLRLGSPLATTPLCCCCTLPYVNGLTRIYTWRPMAISNLGTAPPPVTVYTRGPIKGYIEPYHIYYPNCY